VAEATPYRRLQAGSVQHLVLDLRGCEDLTAHDLDPDVIPLILLHMLRGSDQYPRADEEPLFRQGETGSVPGEIPRTSIRGFQRLY
jgi:hypothetical protein